MSETRSPREVSRALLDGITGGRFTELDRFYAEDAVVEMVFEPVGPRRVEGRAALRERFLALAGRTPLELDARNVVVRATEDPEVVVTEWDYHARNRETGQQETVANLQVLRVRDGLIVHSRDFHDHLALARLLGAAPQWATDPRAE
ncbi:nuclear transport factor 2 family protein [Kitasatospora sp. NPDC058115]|uniref:nuclear transport factor 2 family protein n=1 Tax=Kitasatospora sp. NPDC058115 TaxID=3346347 RepID=UPI0036DC2AA1